MQPLIRRFPNGETPEHHIACDASYELGGTSYEQMQLHFS